MKKILIAGLIVLLTACGNEEPITRIVFAEMDSTTEPYMSRAIITPDFLRMDYNKDDDDFILFERKSGIIYSVVHEEKNIVVVKPRDIDVKSPVGLEVEVVKGVLDKDIPTVEGKKPEYFQYKVNGKVCYETISVPGLLSFANKVHKQYLKTLAGEHARILTKIPADQLDACDLAANIYHYQMKFENGFPINEWHSEYSNGYKRQMVDFEEGYKVNPELLKLPEGYNRYSPSDMTG